MKVKILFKNYGRGKERIILVDTDTNMAFASFGNKDVPYEYLKEKYDSIGNNSTQGKETASL